MEIPISINGSKASSSSSQKSSKYEQEIVKQQKNMTSNLGGILKATAVVATIWTALNPILSPLLKLLSLLALVVFMPLLPHIKEMAVKLGEMVKEVRAGQKGSTSGQEFSGGLGALFGDWGGIGGLIAAGIILKLATGSLAGTLLAALTLKLSWDTITGGDESTLVEKLRDSGYAGLSAGIAAAIFGAGIASIPIAAATMAATLGLSLLYDGLKEESPILATIKGIFGSLGVGTATGIVWALVCYYLLGASITGATIAGAVITLPVTGLVFAIWAQIKWNWIGKTADVLKTPITTLKDVFKKEMATIDLVFPGFKKGTDETEINIPDYGFCSLEEETNKAKKSFDIFNSTVITNVPLINSSVNGLGQMIGSPNKGSYPLVYSLMKAEDEWINMSDISNTAITGIITNLSKIPTKITTIHEIRTVRTSGSSSSSGGFL